MTRVIGLLEVGVDQSKWRQSMGRMEEQERTTRNSNSALGGAPFAPFAWEEFYDYLFLPSPVYRNIQRKQYTLVPSSF